MVPERMPANTREKETTVVLAVEHHHLGKPKVERLYGIDWLNESRFWAMPEASQKGSRTTGRRTTLLNMKNFHLASKI